ncbi:equilibrative nucleoside transporter 1 isoform X2 [Rousettus aegyptiacus]|nr:equilibrative nucleoside transporter 1 isoform X2 [Rousettus aegyptiacus]
MNERSPLPLSGGLWVCFSLPCSTTQVWAGGLKRAFGESSLPGKGLRRRTGTGGAHGQDLLPEPELGRPLRDCPGPLCSHPSAGKSGHLQASDGESCQPGKTKNAVTMTTSHQPQDRYKAVWLIFFVLGLGTLLPWNFFVTASQYFISRLDQYQNTSSTELSSDSQVSASTTGPSPKRNSLSAIFNNVMTLCAMLPLLLFTCLNSFLHQKISQSVRILGSLVAILVVFLITAVLVKVHLDALPFFIITMVKIMLINSFGAILQGSLFGLAGLLPANYTAPIMSGQGLAGIFASVAMICAIASGSELSESSFGYFITACGVIVLAIICYLSLSRLEFYRYYQQLKLEGPGERETKLDLISKGEQPRTGKEEPGVSASNSQTTNKSHSVIAILKNILVPALSVCFIFTVTIGVFPAVTAEVKSSFASTSTWGNYFIPVSCFLTFNVFDWLGRSLTAISMWPGKDSLLLPILVLARVVFVPLLLLCNVQPRRYLTVVFRHDALFIIFMAAFAFSNGYLASLCMCFGPKKVKPAEAETAGTIMAFFLSLGLALGAVFSFLFRAIV